MTVEQNKAFIRLYFESVSGNDKPEAEMDRYISGDVELKQHITVMEAAFPRYELIADDIVAEGDNVAVRATFRGTHKGDLMGIAPTGKLVVLPLIIIYRIAQGRIAEHWLSVDMLSLMQQLEA
jgi:predicted ester cyclase